MHVAICFARTRQAPSGNRGRPGFAAALELLSAAAGYRCAAPPVDVPLRHAAEAAEGHVALKHAAQVRLEAVALSHHEVACKRTRRGPRQPYDPAARSSRAYQRLQPYMHLEAMARVNI